MPRVFRKWTSARSKGRFWRVSLKSWPGKYNQKYYKPNGVLAKILGYYDYFEEQYVCILEGGQQVEKEEIIADYTLAFNEKNKSYSSWYDFTPEMSICAEDVVYTWKDGEMWVHNDNVNYCNFYGTQFNASITSVFNWKENFFKPYRNSKYEVEMPFDLYKYE